MLWWLEVESWESLLLSSALGFIVKVLLENCANWLIIVRLVNIRKTSGARCRILGLVGGDSIVTFCSLKHI